MLKAIEVEKFVSNPDKLQQSFPKPKYYIPDGLKNSSLDDFKEKVVVHLQEGAIPKTTVGPSVGMVPKTSKTHSKIQFYQQPIRAKNLSPGIAAERRLNPGFMFEAQLVP